MPTVQILFFYFAIGGNPIGLKLGVVNHEIGSYHEDCLKSTYENSSALHHDGDCDLHKISCRFLNLIGDDIAIKVFYSTHEDAYDDAKRGNVIGIIEFEINFTESWSKVHVSHQSVEDITLSNSQIKIHLDKTNQQLTQFLQGKIFEVYKKFAETMMLACHLPRNLNNLPIAFLKPIYGSYDSDFKQSMAPVMIMLLTFAIAANLTIAVFIKDRKEGFWNRTLLAGVSTSEIMLAHVLLNSVILFIQLLEVIILIGIVFETPNFGSLVMVALFLTLLGNAGMFYGLLLSCLCTDFMQVSFALLGTSQPMIALAGKLTLQEYNGKRLDSIYNFRNDLAGPGNANVIEIHFLRNALYLTRHLGPEYHGQGIQFL